jgi:hypothetical protein
MEIYGVMSDIREMERNGEMESADIAALLETAASKY